MNNILKTILGFWPPAGVSQNERRYLSSLNRFKERASHYPVELYLETTNSCNLRCIMCVGRQGIDRSTRDLDFRLIRKLKPFIARASTIHPFGYGEPALYPHFVDLLRFIRTTNPDAFIQFVTNGQLYDEEKIKAIIETGIQSITFSIDSVDPTIYASIRRGATLDTVIGTIDHLTEIKARCGLTRPSISLETVLMKSNIDSIDDVLSFCIDKQMDMFILERVRQCPDLEPDSYEAYADIYRSVAMRAAENNIQLVGPFVSEYRKFFYPETDCTETDGPVKEKGRIPIACLSPWSTMYIRCDGEVTTCCVGSPILGNLNTETPRMIWNGAKYRELRRSILSGKHTEECARCISQCRHMMNPLLVHSN